MLAFLRQLWVFVRPYRFRLFLGLLCGCGFALTTAALPLVVKLVPDIVFTRDSGAAVARLLEKTPAFVRETILSWSPNWHAPDSQWGLVATILLIPAIMFLRGFFDYFQAYLMNWGGIRAVTDLRAKLFAHLQNLSVSFFHDARSGELISRVNSDTQVLLQVIGSSLLALVREPVTLCSLLVFLLWAQPRLTLVSVLVFPVCVVPIVIFGRKVRKSARAAQTHQADLTNLMHESFTGNRIIKAYNLEAQVERRFRDTIRHYVSQHMRIVRGSEAPGPMIEFFGSVGVALVLLYLTCWSQPEQQPSIGDFSQFIFSLFLMYAPIKNLSRMATQLQQARAASQRVFELLATPTTVLEPAAPKPLRATGAEIHFARVEFSYGNKPVLRGVDLRIQPGQLVALVGQSGSGKTTLSNLLLRFYDPQCGAITIGGTDIREVATADLRGQMAVVTQETILFNETIGWNIGVGRPGAKPEEIVAAAKHAHAYDFIMEKAGGFDAMVGEKGVMLSGGQRQRLAIARAVLRDAPILILDEATSALDTESERAVQAALEELMQGRTTICIAHRLSTIQRADQIVVLDAGRVVEIGTHAELLQRRGHYFKLHALAFESDGTPPASA